MNEVEDRIQRILRDSAQEVRLMNDSDVDRLLASLANAPVKEHTLDGEAIDSLSSWVEERYPRVAKGDGSPLL